jgi:putative transposase
MARRPRIELGDGIFHVISRGNRRQLIFSDDADRRFFLALLERTCREHKWALHGYCLLHTHYHLVLESTRNSLSAGMRRLNGTYAQGFNSRHNFVGHLFQDRFYSGVIQADEHLIEVVRYVALNPVRAGLCNEASDWPWSSYRALLGWAPEAFVAHERVLQLFSDDRTRARHLIRTFVSDAAIRR